MAKWKEQNTLLSSLQQNVTKTLIRNWNSLINCLSSNIFRFCRKALIFSLNNNSNLARWKIRNSPNCDLCGKTKTQIHALNHSNTKKRRNNMLLKMIDRRIASSIVFDNNTDICVEFARDPFYANIKSGLYKPQLPKTCIKNLKENTSETFVKLNYNV